MQIGQEYKTFLTWSRYTTPCCMVPMARSMGPEQWAYMFLKSLSLQRQPEMVLGVSYLLRYVWEAFWGALVYTVPKS